MVIDRSSKTGAAQSNDCVIVQAAETSESKPVWDE